MKDKPGAVLLLEQAAPAGLCFIKLAAQRPVFFILRPHLQPLAMGWTVPFVGQLCPTPVCCDGQGRPAFAPLDDLDRTMEDSDSSVSIILSTMFIKQHSVFDAVTAFIMAEALYRIPHHTKLDRAASPLSIRRSCAVMDRLTTVTKYAHSAISPGEAHLRSGVSSMICAHSPGVFMT